MPSSQSDSALAGGTLSPATGNRSRTSSRAAGLLEGRKPNSRFADLVTAAIAHANGLDLYSRNADDFVGLADLVRVVAV